ncbi:MAG: hypothetical protein K6G40_04110 [Eubacterium sp.]|nr:hypothetical protein [Eubacterium sp.]
MIIKSSNVSMSSEHIYQSCSYKSTMTVQSVAEKAATLELSEESKSYIAQLKEQTESESSVSISDILGMHKAEPSFEVPVAEDGNIQTLKKILEMLKRIREGDFKVTNMDFDLMKASSQSFSLTFGSFSGSGEVLDLRSPGSTQGTLWTKTTASESYFCEQEATSYSAVGTAITADGREINFGVEMAMSRSYEEYNQSLSQESFILTDPLVINLDSNTVKVTDQKYMFDIDSDGKEEEISFAKEGSGFLALDKNEDGVINDGSELFGTSSGDGFKDLAAYDEDGNGWIDEADSVFSKLKIWTKDEDGNDRLIDLKSADVGAIYLGATDTEFSLKDDENNTNAVIRKTGVYLKESGGVGTIQHVDIAV